MVGYATLLLNKVTELYVLSLSFSLQVSFYNVDAKVHIYTFHDIFTENIFPFFSPCTNKSGKNEMPLIITPVNVTE